MHNYLQRALDRLLYGYRGGYIPIPVRKTSGNRRATMSKLERMAVEVGEAVANRSSLPRLGLEALDAAVKGQVGVEDVNDLYLAYYHAANPSAKVNDELRTSFPFKVNASKLRQLVKLGTEYKSAGAAVVKRALQTRASLAKQGETVKPEYHVMVETARVALRHGLKLSDQMLRKVVTG